MHNDALLKDTQHNDTQQKYFLLKYFRLLFVWRFDIWLIVVTPSAISIMNFVTLYRFQRSIPGSVFSKTIFCVNLVTLQVR
jgi:hypothetical protein